MISQVFIFKISANSTVLAEPADAPFSPRALAAAVLRATAPRQLLLEERADFPLGDHQLFLQKFDADLLVGAATQHCAKKKRFLFREFERIFARIRESGQGIIPSSAFLAFVRDLVAQFNLQSNDPQRLSGTAQSLALAGLDVVASAVPRQSEGAVGGGSPPKVFAPLEPRPSELEKTKNPFLPSDDDEVLSDLATALDPTKKRLSSKRQAPEPVAKEVRPQNRPSAREGFAEDRLVVPPRDESPRKERAQGEESAEGGKARQESLGAGERGTKKMYVLEFEEQGDSTADPKVDEARRLREDLMSDQNSSDGRRPPRGKPAPASKKTPDPIRLEISAEKKRIREEYLLQQQEKAQQGKKGHFAFFMLVVSLLLLGVFVILWFPRVKTG